MLIKDTYHLTYCTNIHPGQDWDATFESLKQYVPGIRKQVTKGQDFGLGLRLSNRASEELSVDDRLLRFRQWLKKENLYVFTMNGFPYGNFHNERVKDQVHTPDWTTKDRLDYTKRLFDQLAYLLPEGISGGISTSPISYRHWFKDKSAVDEAFRKGAEHLADVSLYLHGIEQRTGKYLHLDIEPEPDGLLENTGDVIRFYREHLIPIASKLVGNQLGKAIDEAEQIILRYITLCYDICHFSLAYEEPEYTFKKLEESGIRIGKIQVSAALKILFDKKNTEDIWESLSRFNEPTYLHQVTEKTENGVKTYSDLPLILGEKKDFSELRAHFHVPIFLEQFGKLSSTQDHILKVIRVLKEKKVSEHLEIETYTWEVLPQELKKDLSESIIRELDWLKERL